MLPISTINVTVQNRLCIRDPGTEKLESEILEKADQGGPRTKKISFKTRTGADRGPVR